MIHLLVLVQCAQAMGSFGVRPPVTTNHYINHKCVGSRIVWGDGYTANDNEPLRRPIKCLKHAISTEVSQVDSAVVTNSYRAFLPCVQFRWSQSLFSIYAFDLKILQAFPLTWATLENQHAMYASLSILSRIIV